MFQLRREEARWLRRGAGLTSVISKMLSGSRLPPPTFLVQVTVPLCVTDMMRLATEHAFSCRVASTTCRWPTCRRTSGVSGAKAVYIQCLCYNGFENVSLPCTTSLYKERFLHWASYNHTGHPTAQFPSLLRRQLIYALWEFCQWGNQKTVCKLSFYWIKLSYRPNNTSITFYLLCVKEGCLDSYWDGVVQVSIALQELWKHINVRF